jgi:ankyrin repeat protein
VRRGGQTALLYAAQYDDRPTVAALLGARADVDTKNSYGCAICRRRCPARGRRWPTVTPTAAVPAPSGRRTALHWAAYNGCISAGVELLVGGADQTITNNDG